MFNVGIIGCGGIANAKHLPALKKLKDRARITAFCDVVYERAAKAAREFGEPDAKVCTDYRELLSDDGVDNVRVLTQNRLHAEISVAALKAGKDVLVEKPLCIDPREAEEMIRARDESGRVLAVGYQFKFYPEAQYARRETEKGAFGEIYFGKCRSLRRRGVPTWGVFTRRAEQGAGCLFDIGSHALDEMLYVMDNYEPRMAICTAYDKLKNEPRCANPFGEWDPSLFDVEESAFGFIVMKNGATVILECSWLLNTLEATGPRFMLAGTKAGAGNLDGPFRINSVINDRQTVTEPDLKVGGVEYFGGEKLTPADLEQRNFFDAIEKKAELVNSADRALVVTRILSALKNSAENSRPVYFD